MPRSTKKQTASKNNIPFFTRLFRAEAESIKTPSKDLMTVILEWIRKIDKKMEMRVIIILNVKLFLVFNIFR